MNSQQTEKISVKDILTLIIASGLTVIAFYLAFTFFELDSLRTLRSCAFSAFMANEVMRWDKILAEFKRKKGEKTK